MPLYNIQDADRPAWVFARGYEEAEQKWMTVIAEENGIPLDEVDPPQGISFVCENNELIIEDNWQDIVEEAKPNDQNQS